METQQDLVVAINVHKDTLSAAINCRGKKPWQAWCAALEQLEPDTKRAQIVTLLDCKLAGAKALVDIGLLKPYGKSRTKFCVSKKHAFAVWEQQPH